MNDHCDGGADDGVSVFVLVLEVDEAVFWRDHLDGHVHGMYATATEP